MLLKLDIILLETFHIDIVQINMRRPLFLIELLEWLGVAKGLVCRLLERLSVTQELKGSLLERQ